MLFLSLPLGANNFLEFYNLHSVTMARVLFFESVCTVYIVYHNVLLVHPLKLYTEVHFNVHEWNVLRATEMNAMSTLLLPLGPRNASLPFFEFITRSSGVDFCMLPYRYCSEFILHTHHVPFRIWYASQEKRRGTIWRCHDNQVLHMLEPWTSKQKDVHAKFLHILTL